MDYKRAWLSDQKIINEYEQQCADLIKMTEEAQDKAKYYRDQYRKFLENNIINEPKGPYIEVHTYPQDDKRYENIMSHMNILWHSGKYGSDGCGKCNGYRNILMSAFDKIESMSSRNISQDFATTHRNPEKGKTVKDNNNHVRMVNGEIIGGDKDRDDYANNCFLKGGK
tara:strand:- start:962 stop:1468 length:507 start_codon:yes stop_codon:yes gene_type:complete